MTRILAVALLAFSLLPLGRAVVAGEDELEPGLVAEIFNIGEEINDFPDLKDKKATKKWVDETIDVDAGYGAWPGTDLYDEFAIRWTGVIKTEKDGRYKFYTESDDGSRLFVDGKQIVDNGGVHAAAEEKAGEVELKAGNHEFKIDFFENGGLASCKVSWEPACGVKEVIPAKVLYHKKGTEK